MMNLNKNTKIAIAVGAGATVILTGLTVTNVALERKIMLDEMKEHVYKLRFDYKVLGEEIEESEKALDIIKQNLDEQEMGNIKSVEVVSRAVAKIEILKDRQEQIHRKLSLRYDELSKVDKKFKKEIKGIKDKDVIEKVEMFIKGEIGK